MLVLSRKIGESILIGNDIEVKVLELNGAEVKLGIHAPKSIAILREEIRENIKKQNQSAANVSIPKKINQLLQQKKL